MEGERARTLKRGLKLVCLLYSGQAQSRFLCNWTVSSSRGKNALVCTHGEETMCPPCPALTAMDARSPLCPDPAQRHKCFGRVARRGGLPTRTALQGSGAPRPPDDVRCPQPSHPPPPAGIQRSPVPALAAM